MKHIFLPFLCALTSATLCVAQPQADFSYTDNCQSYTFTDQSTCNGCTIVSWLWALGPMASNEQNPVWYWSYSGPTDVTLYVTDNNGVTVSSTMTVSPVNCIDAEMVTSTVNCQVVISVNVLGGVPPYAYLSSTGATTPSITLQTPGQYAITVVDANGNTSAYEPVTVTQEMIDAAGEGCGQILGRVYNDLNGNGADDQEPGLAGVQIADASGTYRAYSDSEGNYRMFVDLNATYTVAPPDMPTIFKCNQWSEGEQTEPQVGGHTVSFGPDPMSSTDHDFGFQFGPSACATVGGLVFHDQNQNAMQDFGEPGAAGRNVRIESQDGELVVSTQTDAQGYYSVTLPFDTYVVSLMPNNQTYYCGSGFSSVQTFPAFNPNYTLPLTLQTPNATATDFGVYDPATLDAKMVNLWVDNGRNAGQPFNASMDFKITGTMTGTCTLRVDFDPLITLNSSGIQADVVGIDHAEWVFSNTISQCMPLNFTLSPEAETGHVLLWNATITCTAPETCENNNTVVRNRTVLTGPMKMEEDLWEPNNMVVLHTGDPQTGIITHDDSTFSYLINFQNVTSDTAHHVWIVNTISPYLDITSISAPFSLNAFKMYVPDAETVIFEFDDLVLPDSGSSFIDSYGFLQYNIRMRPDLPAGTWIENQASVTFNRGTTVPTNITKNQIALPVPAEESLSAENNAIVFPNPNNGNFRVVIDTGREDTYVIALHDLTGKVVFERQLVHRNHTDLMLNTPLPAGTYLLSIRGTDQSLAGYERVVVVE